MNRKFLYQTINSDSDSLGFPLIICASFYVFGAVFGSFMSVYISDSDYLYAFFSRFFSAFGSAGNISFRGVLFDFQRFLFADLIFSVSAFGLVAVPVLSALKGFLAAFSVALVIRLFGPFGILPSLSLFGVDIFLFTPVFLSASAASFKGSVYLSRCCFGKRCGESYFSGSFWFLFVILILLGFLTAGINMFCVSLLDNETMLNLITGIH